MSENVRGRCLDDKLKKFEAVVLMGREAVVMDEAVIAGVNSVMATITTLAAFMCRGVGADYVARVIMGVTHKLAPAQDPHIICPLFTTLQGVVSVIDGNGVVTYNKEKDHYAVLLASNVVQVPGDGETKQEPAGDGGGISDEEIGT